MKLTASSKFFFVFILLFLLGAGKLIATPMLNSHPSAQATLYLDFDGHDVSSSMWNYGTPFTCLPAAMTDIQITEAFNRVAEDFRPFNINVTTDLTKFLAAPLSQRVRIIITPTSAWYADEKGVPINVAGIAYVTSFTWGDDTPAFVFSDRLVNDAKRVAEAISHETGHTLGLYHQAAYDANCTLTSAYSTGVGTGVTSWGPIMGNAASKNVTQWNNGATPNGCTFLQDNLSIITTTNGFGYRTDDHADNQRDANDITFNGNIFTTEGIITTTTDVDFFRLILPSSGRLTITANPFSALPDFSGANLDVKLTLHDAKGLVIQTFDVSDALNIMFDTTLNAGNYYIQIDGTGSLNNTNDYGSLGAYTIDGSFTSDGNTTPVTDPSDDPEKTKKDLKDEKKVEKKDEKMGTSMNQTLTGGQKEAIQVFTVIKQLQQPVLIKASTEYHYAVFDDNGRIIQTGKGASGTKNIDIRNLPAGIYTLRLMSKRENKTERFMNR